MARDRLTLWLISSSITAVACGSSSPSVPQGNGLLAPPSEGQGLQIAMTSTIAPGQEVERCKFFQVPPGGINVNQATVRYAAGSHHVLLYRTPYSSIPQKTIHGSEVSIDANGVFDCVDGVPGDWEADGIVAGAQSFNGKDAAHFPLAWPPSSPGGTVLIINTHYLNVTPQPIEAEARINLQTIPDNEVLTEGGFLFFYNPFILVRPQSTGSARLSCPISKNIHLVNGQSHMHRRGVAYDAVLKDPSGEVIPLYESSDWENVPVKEWLPKGLELRAGQAIEYTCHYSNPENRMVTQGLTTKDEMCMFLGSYYPRDRELEACRLFVGENGATFVGTGAAGGVTTVQCINDAFEVAEPEFSRKLNGCVVDSCAAVAKPLTAFLTCRVASPSEGGPCHAACRGGSREACETCMTATCGPAGTALAAAPCE